MMLWIRKEMVSSIFLCLYAVGNKVLDSNGYGPMTESSFGSSYVLAVSQKHCLIAVILC